MELNVMWRDAHGRVVSSSGSQSLGWNYPNNGNELLGQSARSVYIALYDIKRLKRRGSLRDCRPNFNGSVDHPLATVSWDGGKEVRNI